MKDKLRTFVASYSHVLTVNMLIDLCNIVGVKPSQLLDNHNDQKNKGAKNSKVQSASEKFLQTSVSAQACYNMPHYLTVDEVAEIFNVKKMTVWAWIREKKLNAIRTGREYRVRPEDIETFNDIRVTRQSIK